MLFVVLKTLALPKISESIQGFELRLDCLAKIDLQKIEHFLRASPSPILFTLRSRSQGGYFFEEESARMRLIEQLFALKPAFFDLEYDVCPSFALRMQKKFPEVKVICSYHNFQKTPEDLETLYKDMHRFPAYAHKMATFANSSLDALRMLLFTKTKEHFTGICMGEKGRITRILGPVVGNLIDYVVLKELSSTGQMQLRELMETYRYSSLNRDTEIYALIGDPVDKSVGAIAHNLVMKKYRINAVYVKIELKKEELPLFFTLARELNIRGISVTMPLKQELNSFVEPTHLLSINTLLLNGQKIKSCTTDGKGALDALEKKIRVKGKKIILLGAGGASRAIAQEALERGALVVVLNRTKEKAINLYKEAGGGLERFAEEARHGYDILINTTCDPLPIDPESILPQATVMDIQTIPFTTPFLAKALEKGCSVIRGIEMYIHQAAAQDSIWFGNAVNATAIEEMLYSHFMI